MRRWWDRLFVVLILAIAGLSIYAVWPNEPDRYLPDILPWPSGQGIPSTIGGLELPCHTEDETNTNDSADCKGIVKGLDLEGGSRIVLQADLQGRTDVDVGAALEAAKEIIENRINPFGVSESSVQVAGDDRLIVELPGVSAATAEDVTRPAILMFCEGLQPNGIQSGAGSPIGIVPPGNEVIYKPGTCEPDVDADGMVLVATTAPPPPTDPADPGVDGGATPEGTARIEPSYVTIESIQNLDNVVWTPAKGELDGVPTTMTGAYLQSNSFVTVNFAEVLLIFNMTDDGEEVFGSLSQRMVGLPLATFLDGEPIRGDDGRIIAPIIQSQITDQGSTTGLTLQDARRLSTLLNNGAFPIPLRVIQQTDVDATLGDEAVRHSVQAGLVALLLIMAFMTLYYRLPGVLASLALIVYTGVVLAIFKIGIPGSGPVTITLAGVAAFVLSVGMAVDANILIFERMREELRNGRSLIPAVMTGFDRAFSSIRDSNVSTLITCAILYWMGDQFGSPLIKGFALTLSIGVIVSLFSAITVTRTFLRMAMATPLARARWLWTDDRIEDAGRVRAGATVASGGAPGPEVADRA